MLRLLLVATLTGCTTAVGAVPFLFAREISRRTYDLLLGFGAGLMLAAATLGLLPAALRGVRVDDAVDAFRLARALGGFAAGVALLALLDRLIPHLHAGGHLQHQEAGEHGEHANCDHKDVDDRARHQGLLVLGAMSLHRLPEGFAIGAGFAAGALRPLGIMLAVAVAAQNAVEGAVMAAPLRRGGLGPIRLLLVVGATGLTVPAAALAGYFLSGANPGALPIVLALAAGALIYLTCNEIIPESHSHANERRATFGLISGFVLIILLQVLTGHAD
ncbi:MAG TPA: ZIP family metal transporter [Polyangia bacterium]|nr:ZIP family metal transporter [Polyangia bacterium]